MRVSVVAAGVVAVLVGFASTLAVVVAAAVNLGGSPAEVVSWVWALCLGIGVSSLVLSLVTRQPVVTAWSLAGAVLIAGLPGGVGMGEAIGAFVLAGALTVLSGLVPALGAAAARLPAPVAAGMLAGLLLRYVLAVFQAIPAEPWLVLPLLAAFLVARGLHAASAPLVVIAVGLPLAWVMGHPLPAPQLGLAVPVWTLPALRPGVLLGLGIPLFLVTMATQQIPGAAVLRVSGYVPRMRLVLVVTGGLTMLLAPLGAFALNLSSLTAALCTSPDAHPDPAQRWRAGMVYGGCYVVLAVFGAGFATMMAGLPVLLVSVVVGSALMGPLINSVTAAVSVEGQRFAAMTAFGVTASGMSVLGLSGAFWGLVAGVVVLTVERVRRVW